MSLRVFDEQQGGPTLHQAGHHPGEALPMQPRGKHKCPGGTVAIRQLERLTQICTMTVCVNMNSDTFEAYGFKVLHEFSS